MAIPRGFAQFRPRAPAERHRHAAQQRAHCGHHDRPEAQQAGLIDRIARIHSFVPLGGQREIDHHDRILLHDADQQDNSDHGDDVQLGSKQHHRHQRADAGRWQRRNDRQRMNQAFVQHSQDDVDGEQRGADQNRLVRERLLECLRGAGELAGDAQRANPSRFPLC